MTGLYPQDISENYSDTLDERYQKMRNSVQRLAPLQVGFCCWKKEGDEYIATPFTFYLFPSERDFLVSSSAFKFLTENNYDFNKTFKEGIPFINQNKAKELMGKTVYWNDKEEAFVKDLA